MVSIIGISVSRRISEGMGDTVAVAVIVDGVPGCMMKKSSRAPRLEVVMAVMLLMLLLWAGLVG